ncbi:LysR family transcriptional regulator [Ensifer sp. ENS05]|uniref:LysR family transcriptional regulator n=1 Tax=Ensifer sp. ENS05 TaxID=2769277 RepID=UPI00177D0247|nr:LysR family transcriptional regulator [Ensifer sp. ENS05]MBD9596400.1 LysR family transcriptional regulator [Ensifer sp. ENS05]
MPSIKQVEAFVWSANLGSFVAAADHLNTTQSNISKRLQELEHALGVLLFERTKRSIRLTPKGEELLSLSNELLDAHKRLLKIRTSDLAWRGALRCGFTEAVALTALSRLSASLQQTFPGLIPDVVIDTSFHLNELLRQGKIDFAIATSGFLDAGLVAVKLFEAERVWMASPKLVPHDRVLTASELAKLPMLGHGDLTLPRNVVVRYLKSLGIAANIVTSCTSISALAQMTIEGIGVTYLHKEVFEPEIASGQLKILNCEVKLPPIQYYAAYREEMTNPALPRIVECAREVFMSAQTPLART